MRSILRQAMIAATLSAALQSAAWAADPAPDDKVKQLFLETIEASRTLGEIKHDRLAGPAADFLKARASESKFVLIGEEHGVATIADTVRAMLPTLKSANYRAFAIEVDPYMTAKLGQLLKTGGTPALAKFLARDGHGISLPFYNWGSEAALAEAAQSASGGGPMDLWGLDQVFIGAFHVLLKDIAEGATSADAKAAASALAAQSKGAFDFPARVEFSALEDLRSKLNSDADKDWKAMVTDMILSVRIYHPFVGKEGLSVYAANLERENLMKRTLMERANAAGHPKTLFKFGAYHMMKGLSGTHVPALGAFAESLALSRGEKAFNLLIICGPNSKGGTFDGQEVPCDLDWGKLFPEAASLADSQKLSLFDLKPWKDKPRRWAHLPEATREWIWAFDAILVVPNGKPAKAIK